MYDIFTNGLSDIDEITSYIPIKELLLLLKQKEKHTREIVKNLRVLKSITIEIETTEPDDNVSITGISLLRKYKIDNHNLFYTFEPEILEMILNPVVYQSLQLSILNDFSSKNTLHLYENIKRYENVKTTGYKSLDYWKSLLCDKPTDYADFRMFHNKLIKKSVDEINKLSDINVSYDFKKNGTKVTQICFNITKRNRTTKTTTTEKELSLVLPDKKPFEETIISLVNENKLSLRVFDTLTNKKNIEDVINKLIEKNELSLHLKNHYYNTIETNIS